MSAFGRRGGTAGAEGAQRPSFGVARPMQAIEGRRRRAIPADRGARRRTGSADGRHGPPRQPCGRRAADATTQIEGFEASVHRIKEQVLPRLTERVDPEAAATLGKDELAEEFRPIIGEVLAELKINLNRRRRFALEKVLVDELLGLGTLEELLADPEISDIMVNGPGQTYVERGGRLEKAHVQFRDEEHLFQIARDRLQGRPPGGPDDAARRCPPGRWRPRQRVIVPPLSLRGTAISIRKFSTMPITIDMMAKNGTMSEKMATCLKIAGACRFNIIISGGTGSSKTTMLNALSKMIDPGERVITIEDAAELRLQQPH